MHIPRTRLLAAAACLVVAAPVAIAATASAGPIAHTATATCPKPNSPAYPNGYYNRLVVTGTSCASGKRLMHAHHRCRTKHGVRGKCAHVSGYSCTEKRPNSIPTEFNARVTCKNGSRKVVYYYTQNT